MGGLGSGRSCGWRGPTVGSYESIDIRELRKAGYVGQVGLWVQWRTGRVLLEFIEGAVDVTFDGAERSTYRIMLDETPCYLGGVRTWFLCPRCGSRTVELHLCDEKLACRRCHELTYSSQRERAADRARRRRRKIRARLGMGPNLFLSITEKPKGMRWSTFYRLRERDLGSAGVSISDMVRFLEQRRMKVCIDPRAFQR